MSLLHNKNILGVLMLTILNKIFEKESHLFKFFYAIQLFLTTIGLIRGTAFGYILHRLDVSPFFLSLFFVIGILSNIFCYFLFPFFMKKLQSPIKSMIAFELICLSIITIILGYLFYLSYIESFGNYWLWSLLNLLIFLQVFGSTSCRPLLVKEKFPHSNFKNIIRLDLIFLSTSKLLGYALGVFIISINVVISIFIISFFASIIAILFYIKLYNTVNTSSDLQSIFQKKEVVDHYYSPFLSYLICFIPSIFLIIFSVQAVFFNKTFGIPYYIFPLCSSLGGLTFNLFLNKNLSLNLNTRFYFQGLILFICFINFAIFTSPFILLPSLFLIGGIYTTMSNISTSRIYSYSKTREAKSISRYYFFITLMNVIGTIFAGILFEITNLFNAFFILSLLILFVFILIAVLNKYKSFDILS